MRWYWNMEYFYLTTQKKKLQLFSLDERKIYWVILLSHKEICSVCEDMNLLIIKNNLTCWEKIASFKFACYCFSNRIDILIPPHPYAKKTYQFLVHRLELFQSHMREYTQTLHHISQNSLSPKDGESFVWIYQDIWSATQAFQILAHQLTQHNISYQKEDIFLKDMQQTKEKIEHILSLYEI